MSHSLVFNVTFLWSRWVFPRNTKLILKSASMHLSTFFHCQKLECHVVVLQANFRATPTPAKETKDALSDCWTVFWGKRFNLRFLHKFNKLTCWCCCRPTQSLAVLLFYRAFFFLHVTSRRRHCVLLSCRATVWLQSKTVKVLSTVWGSLSQAEGLSFEKTELNHNL